MTALPNIQNAQYGDTTKLEQLGATRMTDNPAADVQVMKDMVGGRPLEKDPVKLATRFAKSTVQGSQQLDPEQQQYATKFNTLASQLQTVKKWVALANSPRSGPFTKSYAMAVVRAFQQNVMKTRGGTPFYEEE
jgi:hypothetical protein